MCTDRETKKEKSFTFSLFALIHNLMRNFRINEDRLTKSYRQSLYAVSMIELSSHFQMH